MKTNNINYDNEFSALHYARPNAPQAENDIKTCNKMFDNVLGALLGKGPYNLLFQENHSEE